MIDPGSVAIGALCIIALMAGFVGYLFRGHRIDATGLKVVRSRGLTFAPSKPYTGEALLEWTDKDGKIHQQKPEDFFEMAKDRGGE